MGKLAALQKSEIENKPLVNTGSININKLNKKVYVKETGDGIQKRLEEYSIKKAISSYDTQKRKPLQSCLKRLLDIVLSLFLLILVSPIFLVISAAIKLTSSGNIIFKQIRIGQNRRTRADRYFDESLDRRNQNLKGKPFYIYKFRTMYEETPHYALTPKDSYDPRITRLGRALRKSCLDELPQLINVFKGDMSLVGPRPEMPFIVKDYNKYQDKRLDSKPGITGMWQLYGSRDKAIHEELQYDVFYVRNWNLLMDFQILLNTMIFALKAKNM